MAKVNKNVLKALKAVQTSGRVTKDVGEPLLKQGLIEVNTNDVVDGAAAARLTDAGVAAINETTNKPIKANEDNTVNTQFQILSGVELPASKRGFGCTAGPSKYPFATMEVGNSFFVAATDEMPDPIKTLGSTISNTNNKYRVPTGQTKTVERTKRGEKNRAVLDDAGNKVRETVSVPVYEFSRKYVIRKVESGKAYGNWTAPANGALIARTK